MTTRRMYRRCHAAYSVGQGPIGDGRLRFLNVGYVGVNRFAHFEWIYAAFTLTLNTQLSTLN